MKQEKLEKEIYDKVKQSGVRATKQSLMDLGYTEYELRSIKIKIMNFELFGK